MGENQTDDARPEQAGKSTHHQRSMAVKGRGDKVH
jgi:hypothetical protein